MTNYTVNATICRETEKNHPFWKNAWYGMNSTNNFGCCTYLYKKYNEPQTYQAFYDNYVNDISGYKPQTYGRSEDYLYQEAEKLKERSGEDYPIEDYYNYIVKKLIVDTYDGCNREKCAAQYIENHGFIVKEPTIQEDKDFGIDLKCYKGETLKFLVQIKPNTFFMGNSNRGLLSDRKSALQKEEICNEKYGVPVFYILYDKNTGEWIKNNNGSIAHKLSDLLWDSGFTKYKYNNG